MANYDEYSDLPNNFFTKCRPEYDKERLLYDVLEMEAYNKFGVQMRYYTLDMSNSDTLFGENNNLLLTRAFDYMAYFELPSENKSVGILGIIGMDNFPIYINKMHYDFVSQYSSSGVSATYPTYSPKIGDIVYSKYNQQFYRVNMVKMEDEIFLQGKHTYTLFLEVFKDKGYSVSQELQDLDDDPIFDVVCF